MIKILKKRTVLKKFPQGPSLEKGYAIFELLFYIALFTILILAVINSMITMTRSFRETAVQSEFVQSGTIMERIGRENRGANGINTISATDLVLNTKDINGVNKTVEFLLSGANIKLLESSVLTGNLNTPNISVTALAFTQITEAQGKAVKVSLTLKVSGDASGRLVNFYDTVVLRGIY